MSYSDLFKYVDKPILEGFYKDTNLNIEDIKLLIDEWRVKNKIYGEPKYAVLAKTSMYPSLWIIKVQIESPKRNHVSFMISDKVIQKTKKGRRNSQLDSLLIDDQNEK